MTITLSGILEILAVCKTDHKTTDRHMKLEGFKNRAGKYVLISEQIALNNPKR